MSGTGLRFNEGKLRYDLVQPWAHEQMVAVLTMGANKYASRNWEQGMVWSNVISSLKRHIAAIEAGEDFDKESGLLHAAHVACNAHFLTAYYKIYPQGDDRPHGYLKPVKIGLDIDEVLCDFRSGWAALHGVDPQPGAWSYHRLMSEEFAKMIADGSLDTFYASLDPLISPSDIPFEPTCYVTSRPISSEVTEAWLDKHKFPASKVITVGVGASKVAALKEAGVDIFVDDRYENFIELNNAGICCFLMDASHNRRYNVGFKRIHSLKELI